MGRQVNEPCIWFHAPTTHTHLGLPDLSLMMERFTIYADSRWSMIWWLRPWSDFLFLQVRTHVLHTHFPGSISGMLGRWGFPFRLDDVAFLSCNHRLWMLTLIIFHIFLSIFPIIYFMIVFTGIASPFYISWLRTTMASGHDKTFFVRWVLWFWNIYLPADCSYENISIRSTESLTHSHILI